MAHQRPGESPDPRHVAALLRTVNEARSHLDDQRSEPQKRHTSTAAARRDLLSALESYADALTSLGQPMPYRLRDELHLYRQLDLSG